MMDPFRHRVAVVTGASAGIGEAIARGLAAQGASVVLNARREERLAEVVGEINAAKGEAVACPGDAGDPRVITAMLDRARDHFGSEANLVVVNAGRGLKGSVYDSDTDQWEEMVRTNLLGAARLMREAARRMVEDIRGDDWQTSPRDIFAIGSTVGRHISPFSSMYGATKFGVHALAEALRREVGPKGVRVTLIEPAVVKSEFQDVAGYDPATFGQFMDKIGPVLSPEDVARAIVFVASQPGAVHVSDLLIRPTRQDYP
ncbi:MAG: SDR family oxidoreductase [Phycisphaerales bacterium]